MRTRAAEQPTVVTEPTETSANDTRSFGAAAKQVAEHASALARLEMELASLELKRKMGALGLGIGLAVAAGTFLWFAFGFGLAAAAAGLATALPLWLALLIVFGVLLLVGLILGFLALGRIKRGSPPLPEQAIEEAKRTTTVLKSNGA
ncbi:MAG: phage holin family protein [Actinobacteria bacterium]|nr:phage holin family protein [Actinomycetota bacterium]